MNLRLAIAFLMFSNWAAAAAPAAKGTVDEIVFHDSTYGVQRHVWLYKSPPAAARHDHVLVFLAGDAYRSDFAVPALLDALTASHDIPPVVAVMVDTSDLRPVDMANRDRFATFIASDLVPQLRRSLGGLPPPANVTIAGFSIGGLAAAYIAMRHPEIFGNVLSQSGAFWRGNEGASTPAEWLTSELRARPALPLRFYVEVGAAETITTPGGVVFIEANRHLRDVLAAKKYTFRYVEVAGAHHDVEHWKAALPKALIELTRPALSEP